MDRFQAAVTALSSLDSDAEPATDKAADRISKGVTGHEFAAPAKPLGGQFVHYALGAGLGALYGIAVEYRREAAAGHGAAFGITVAAVLDDAVVPALGLGSSPFKTGFRTHVYAMTSHIVFGTVVEFTRVRVRSALGTINEA